MAPGRVRPPSLLQEGCFFDGQRWQPRPKLRRPQDVKASAHPTRPQDETMRRLAGAGFELAQVLEQRLHRTEADTSSLAEAEAPRIIATPTGARPAAPSARRCCCFEFLGVAPARVTFRSEQREVKDLVSGSLSSDDLQAEGVTARHLRKAGAARLKAIGFSAEQLRSAGGFSAAKLRAAGFGLAELKAAGYSVRELYRHAAFEAEALKTAGFTAQDCRDHGMEFDDIGSFHFDLKELLHAGYGPKKKLKKLFFGEGSPSSRKHHGDEHPSVAEADASCSSGSSSPRSVASSSS